MAPTHGLGTKEISTAMQKLLGFLPDSSELNIHFLGVMPFDLFPLSRFTASCVLDALRDSSKFPPNQYAICCIVNTDPSSKPGKHWVAFFRSSHGKLEFFDSYGRPPNHFGFPIGVNMLDASCCEYNSLTLQADNTSVCGQYCILFLFLRCLLAIRSNNAQTLSSSTSNYPSSNSPLKSISSFLHSLAATSPARDKEIRQTHLKLLCLNKLRHSSCTRYLFLSTHTALEQNCTSAFSEPFDSS